MHREFIQKLTNLVEANLANEKFGSEELAREAGMSHTNLNRKLKIISNQNVSQFIREIRLKKAKELLLNTDLTIAEISYRVGFGSPTYFSRCFHEYYGVAPGESRNHEQVHETEEQPVEPMPIKHPRSKILIGLIVSLIVIIPTAFLAYQKTHFPDDKSIAVLPFINDSQDSTNVYFINGVTETITDKLTQIKDLKVTSRTSAERFRNNKTKSISQIARELGVKYILEGSGQKIGDSVLVSIQLIEARNDKHILSRQFTVRYENVLTLYSEIAFDVASEIKALITPKEKKLIQKTPTANPVAYNLYQRGRDQFDNYSDSITLENAQRLFQKALELDSTFALAYSGLAGVYLYRNYWKTFLSENFMDSVLILTNKALAYDDKCAEAYYFSGRRFYNIGKLPECLKEFDKAIKLNPDYWKIYNHRSFILWEGSYDFVGAISNMNNAILRSSVEQLPDLLIDLGMAYISIGFPEKGKEYWQQALELYGDSAVYLYWTIQAEYCRGNYEKAYQSAKIAYKWDSTRVKAVLPWFCVMAGRDEEACNYYEKLAERLKKSGEVDLFAYQGIGYSYWKMGRIKEAEYYFDQQIKIDLECIRLGRWNVINGQAQWDLAKVYAFRGDKEKAYRYLDEVNRNQAFPLWWVTSFKYDPFFKSIRQEPRFHKILKDVEAKYQAEHERVRKWMVKEGIM
jgi:TolB-like protein/AraC-like DNA-binding protein/Tfp pilus assembly protein PilF